MSRNYEELREKLGGEMMYNKNKNLPCNEADIAEGEDDSENYDFITYLVVTNNTAVSYTHLDVYKRQLLRSPVMSDGTIIIIGARVSDCISFYINTTGGCGDISGLILLETCE